MFDFINMSKNYDQRKIDRLEQGELIVSTCSITDSDGLYETAVQHPGYNDGNWVIAETYDDAESAQKGHDRWVVTMTAKDLPIALRDVSSAKIAQLLDNASDENWRDCPRN